MVARMDEALRKRKRRRYGEPFTRAPNLKCAHFAKNGYGLRLMVVTNTSLANFLYLCFAFTLQDHLVPTQNFQKLKISYPYYG